MWQSLKPHQEIQKRRHSHKNEFFQASFTYSLNMDKVVALRRPSSPVKLVLRSEVFLANDTEFKPVSERLVINMNVDANVTVNSLPIIERLPLQTSTINKTLEAKFQV